MGTLWKDVSVDQGSRTGGGDEKVDLKDRVHRLGDLDSGDEQETELDFMGPEAYEIAELLRKVLLYKDSSQDSWQSPRHCIQTQ